MEELNFDESVYEAEIKKAEALTRLMDNEDFKLVFIKGFLEDWAITQVYACGTYNQNARAGLHEKMMARGIFSNYLEQVMENGNNAAENLDAMRAEDAEAQPE